MPQSASERHSEPRYEPALPLDEVTCVDDVEVTLVVVVVVVLLVVVAVVVPVAVVVSVLSSEHPAHAAATITA
jgi:hypothetical protein